MGDRTDIAHPPTKSLRNLALSQAKRATFPNSTRTTHLVKSISHTAATSKSHCIGAR